MTREPAACRNCAAALAGPFCAQCGQRAMPPDPTLREIVAEAWETFVAVDGKVLSSIRLLLTRPGALTAEYLLGHRARFLPPLRLYLVCSVLYFLVAAALPDRPTMRSNAVAEAREGDGINVFEASGDNESTDATRRARAVRDSVRRIERDSIRRATLASIGRSVPPGPLDSASRAVAESVRLQRKIVREVGANPSWIKRTMLTRFLRNTQRITDDQKTFGRYMKDQLPRMMFVLMPVFAALLALVYRSRRRRYPAHLIVALHLHAFGFAVAAVLAPVALLPRGPRRTLAGVLLAWCLVYFPLALRRVYGGRLRMAVLRMVALAGLYSVVAVIGVTTAAILAILAY